MNRSMLYIEFNLIHVEFKLMIFQEEMVTDKGKSEIKDRSCCV